MISRPSPCVRFSRRARVRNAAMESAGVSSMKKFRCSSSWLTDSTRSKSRADQLALADLFRRDLGLLGDHAGGELLGRHFEREEADHGAIGHLRLAVLAVFLAIGPGGIEADVGGERALAHRRPAGQDDQVRPVQAAEQLVELEQAGGHAGELAGPVIGRLGGDRGLGERGAERLEAALGLAGAGEVIELLLRALDLRQRGILDVAAEGAVDDAFAEIDELPPEIEIVDRPAERRRRRSHAPRLLPGGRGRRAPPAAFMSSSCST